MAIIYTYPPLTNPQGNELIVVSDVNNKNATRLITIADIASLVPGGGGGGCATAITGILDSAGNPLYTAAACSEMELISSDGTVGISPTATGINLQVGELRCARKEELGGVKITNSFTIEQTPEPYTDNVTIYPIETSDEESEIPCTAVVRIPNAQSSGGTVTSVAATTAGDALDVGGSPITTSGTLAFTWAGASTDYINGEGNLTTFPSINDGTLTITVDGTPSTFTANQSGNTNVSITTGGSGGTSKNGFTPMSIYDSDNTIGQAVVSAFVQTVVEDDCKINKMDFAATGAVPNGTVIALYKGKLIDPGNTILLGSGTLTGAIGGEFIYTIDLIPVGGSSGDIIDIKAGEDIVIFYSRTATNGFHLGKATTSFTNNAIGQKVASPQIVEADLVDSISTVIASSGAGESTNVSVPRLGCHFYEGASTPVDPVVRFEYEKCATAESTSCEDMPLTVVIEDNQSVLDEYLVIADNSVPGASCCYFRLDGSTATPTPNMAVVATFPDCETLPDRCIN